MTVHPQASFSQPLGSLTQNQEQHPYKRTRRRRFGLSCENLAFEHIGRTPWYGLSLTPLDNQDERYILPTEHQEERGRSMTDKPSDLVQGTLDMLVLKTVALEPTHGYGIAVRIEQMSKGVFRVNAGSLFVAIQRLQRDGLIRGEWKATENSRRAKYYILTERGRQRLDSEKRQWGRQAAAIARILEAS